MSDLAKRVAARFLAVGPEGPITLTLQSSSVNSKNQVRQTWRVDAPGKSVVVKTFTGDGGHLEFLSKQDFDVEAFGKRATAKALVQHVIYEAGPDYYPMEGETVELDQAFFDGLQVPS